MEENSKAENTQVMPSSLSRKALNCSPCSGFVSISANMSVVGLYMMAVSFYLTRSCRKKYRILIWRV